MAETLFKEVRYNLGGLVEGIELGVIGLPDIQRPFVWKNIKVRDLFDSMYHGYPVGYLLFWQNGAGGGEKTIGVSNKMKTPNLLIVDGQQRLTSLYAVVRGISVIRENFNQEKIEIAFNPLHEKFEVADAAIRRDKAFIPNISVLWQDDADMFEIVDEYLDKLASARDVAEEERKQIKKAFTRLQNLTGFPFTALELSAHINEEQVSEVFVRINSKGKPLSQADFILTLMSVFWDEGRAQIEDFCRKARTPSVAGPSPFNHFIQPSPDQLLRVSVGHGFKRARLKYVYSILRGKNLETEEFSEERRVQQFDVLKEAQAKTLNLQHWHDFLKAVMLAGYRSVKMISSQNALLFAYILYLMGRTEYKVEEFTLRKIIAKWFFMSSLTGRYSGSPESAMEFDLARFREVKSDEDFVSVLDRVCEEKLTNDFWSITLPSELATSAGRSPSMFAYYASLVLLDARVLFSKQKVSELLDPALTAQRSAIERHHLFPKGHLKSVGTEDLRETNQIANFALVEWGDNAEISKKPPVDYAPELMGRFSPEERKRMSYWHALPDGWETMDYRKFLIQRRELIARIILNAYKLLKGEGEEREKKAISVEELVGDGENVATEFKSTLRINTHTDQPDSRIEMAVLKTIAGFLNREGGTLIIGVFDDGTPVGVEADKFPNDDKMNLHFDNLVRDRIGPEHSLNIHSHFEDYKGTRVMVVECWASKKSVYVKDGQNERFFVRSGASTIELSPKQTEEFIKQRFN